MRQDGGLPSIGLYSCPGCIVPSQVSRMQDSLLAMCALFAVIATCTRGANTLGCYCAYCASQPTQLVMVVPIFGTAQSLGVAEFAPFVEISLT